MSSGALGGILGALISRRLVARYGKRTACIIVGTGTVFFGLVLFALMTITEPDNPLIGQLVAATFALVGTGELIYAWRLRSVGLVDGRHRSAHSSKVYSLLRQGDVTNAESLLIQLIQASEEEARVNGWPVEARYYQELAKLYRIGRHEARERDVLERYAQHTRFPFRVPYRLQERLAALRSSHSVGSLGGA